MKVVSVQNVQKYFWCFTLIHCALWITLPLFLHHAIPRDSIEGFVWGQHLEWSYDRNPWMNAWLTRAAWLLTGKSDIAFYALSSFFVGLGFWSVWKIAQLFVTPAKALLSVVLLECCVNYTIFPLEFNDNTIELGLWPLLFLFFYRAIETQKTKAWIITGIIAGLAMMTKYYAPFLFVIMLLYLILYKNARVSFTQKGLYYSLICFIVIITPNMIWLCHHHFLTITYAVDRAYNTLGFWQLHIISPIRFFNAQTINFILPFLIVLFFSRKHWHKPHQAPHFLYWVALGPFFLTLLAAIIFGWRLHNGWGAPLVSLWGLLLVCVFQPEISLKKTLVIGYTIMLLWTAGYAAAITLEKSTAHNDNYPAKAIANFATRAWHNRYHKPLKYVAGSRYIAGYVALYSKDHPSVFVSWNKNSSEWINTTKMEKYGALFIVENDNPPTINSSQPKNKVLEFPPRILKKYPGLILMPIQYFHYYHASKLQAFPVLIGFLPPQG